MLRLHDTMTKQRKVVEPLKPGVVKMYTCGPTVYRDPHIGNYRSYLMSDWIRRILEYQGLEVRAVKNITDVGHMRQEDLEQGDDKIISAALAEGKSPHEIAEFYTARFMSDETKLNIKPANSFPKATDHVEEMIHIIKTLLNRDHAYEAGGNIYFSVSSFPKYGQLSGNTGPSDLLEGVRMEVDALKKDPRDFTLWKAAEPGRNLKWPSPWGEGFPGWHIECSAMSVKYLGDQFDIHTGGVDNIFPHHEDELAQSESYTGKPLVSIWAHGQHLLCDGVKMSKSMGNSFVLADIESKGIDVRSFRYLCLTTRYNNRMNFTYTALKASNRALQRLQNRISELRNDSVQTHHLDEHDTLSHSETRSTDDIKNTWVSAFLRRVNDNLDMPRALELTWLLLRSNIPPSARYEIALEYDKILGLGLEHATKSSEIPRDVSILTDRRASLRMSRTFDKADAIRKQLEFDGYALEDVIPVADLASATAPGSTLKDRNQRNPPPSGVTEISSSGGVDSFLEREHIFDFTVGIVTSDYQDDVKRCIESTLKWNQSFYIEFVVVNNTHSDESGQWLSETASKYPNLRLIHTDHVFGSASAQNIILKQSLGKTILLIDTSVEMVGDVFTDIESTLSNDKVGVVGPFGLRTDDLQHFHEGEGETGYMDAMQSYMFAFRRSRIRDVGLMRESFRFYRNLDIDYSFQFKDKGLSIFADHSLPVLRHEHRAWSDMPENDRDDLSRKNYGRFLHRWGHRTDLLVRSGSPNE